MDKYIYTSTNKLLEHFASSSRSLYNSDGVELHWESDYGTFQAKSQKGVTSVNLNEWIHIPLFYESPCLVDRTIFIESVDDINYETCLERISKHLSISIDVDYTDVFKITSKILADLLDIVGTKQLCIKHVGGELSKIDIGISETLK